MSEVVRYKGKIKKIDIAPRKVEAYLHTSLSDEGKKRYTELMNDTDVFDNNYEFISWFDELEDRFVIVKGFLYEIISKKNLSDDHNIFDAVENNDGTIDYHVMYYNGGCCFDEAIDWAIEDMNKED